MYQLAVCLEAVINVPLILSLFCLQCCDDVILSMAHHQKALGTPPLITNDIILHHSLPVVLVNENFKICTLAL